MKWRGGEMEKPPLWVTLYHGYCSPLERQNMAKRERKRGWGMRQQRGRRKAWRQSGVWEGYVMTWKSQPVGHAGLWEPLSDRKALESSLSAYLVLVGARIQGMNLSLTPACKQTKYRGKDEVWSRGCCCLHTLSASVSLPLALGHQPPIFSTCVSKKSNTTPFHHWCPELLNFPFYLFATWTIEVSQNLQLSSSCLKALNNTLQFKSSLAFKKRSDSWMSFLMIHVVGFHNKNGAVVPQTFYHVSPRFKC